MITKNTTKLGTYYNAADRAKIYTVIEGIVVSNKNMLNILTQFLEAENKAPSEDAIAKTGRASKLVPFVEEFIKETGSLSERLTKILLPTKEEGILLSLIDEQTDAFASAHIFGLLVKLCERQASA